jgi:hypothetical protein
MDQKYKKHLKVYSALTTGLALFANQDAEAQVISRDIDPDAVFSGQSFSYDLDFDNDGNVDFWLVKYTYTYTYNTTQINSDLSIYPNLYDNSVLVNNHSNDATRFDFGTELYDQPFRSYGLLFNADVTNTPYLNRGDWESGTTDKYFGVKFLIGDNFHYGWVKMSISSDFQTVTVSELAYESSPGVSIFAGFTENVPDATNIVAEDVSDNNNVTDLGISFDKASDETNIAGYKVFVVPTDKAASFNYASIATLSADQYVDVAKTGSNIQFTCLANLLDSQGDAIAAGTSYSVFVMTVAVGNFNNSLVKSNSEIILTKPSDGVSNVIASDIANNNNGADLSISFNKATDETTLSGYKVVVVRSTNTVNVDLDILNALDEQYKYSVAKTGSDLMVTLPSDFKDQEGFTVENGVSYTVYVLSVGELGYTNTFVTSNEIVLTSPVGVATNLSVSQVAHNGNGTDLQVNFDKIAEENTIESYSVLVVPTVDAPAFDLAKAETAIIDANAYNVDVTNANLSVTLSELTKDANGDLLTVGVSYTVFVVSNHKGTAFSNAISDGSNEITIEPMITGVSATDNTIHVTCFENVVRLSNVNTESDLTLVNSQGVVVYTAKVQKGDSQIELSSLSAGIYLVKVGSQSTKVVLSSK